MGETPQPTPQEMGLGPKNAVRAEPQKTETSKRSRAALLEITDKYDSPQDRLTAINTKIEPVFKYIDKTKFSAEQIAEAHEALAVCTTIQDKDQFLESVMRALKPVIDVLEANPNIAEEIRAKAMNEAGK